MGKGWKAGPRGGKLVKPVDIRSLKIDAPSQPEAPPGAAVGVDKFALYQDAVQAPQGDISWILRFYREYVGLQVPLHLREDFCGTAMISATWCRGDVRRTAIGVDLDKEALMWGALHNGDGMLGGSAADQFCLLHSNVLDDVKSAPRITPAAAAHPVSLAAGDKAAQGDAADGACGDDMTNIRAQSDSTAAQGSAAAAPAGEAASADADGSTDKEEELRGTPADVVASVNFSLCLLHTREDAMRYLRLARAAMQQEHGSIMVLDLLGGPSAECDARIDRSNTVTGASFLWEQEGYNPVTREIYCHISLRRRGIIVLPRIWNYHWRLWTIPEATELLLAAGFHAVHTWLRPMRQTGCAGEDDEDEEADFLQCSAQQPLPPDVLQKINSRGWVAYLVAVVQPQQVPVIQKVTVQEHEGC